MNCTNIWMCFLCENAIKIKAFKRCSNDVWKPCFYRVCAIIFSHFVLYPDFRISFFTPLAFRFADYTSPEYFQRKNPHFPEWIFRPNVHFFPSLGSISGFFSCHPIKNSILPEYFSSHPAGIFTFPAHFCTVQTRAHLHARNNILSTPPGFLSLIPQNLP